MSRLVHPISLRFADRRLEPAPSATMSASGLPADVVVDAAGLAATAASTQVERKSAAVPTYPSTGVAG